MDSFKKNNIYNAKPPRFGGDDAFFLLNVPSVVVVSDDSISRYRIRHFLESEKIPVAECTIQQCLDSPPPDHKDIKLYVIDVTNSFLPEDDLYENLKYHFQGFPIIILDPAPRTSERVLRYIHWEYLSKPCLPEDIKRMLVLLFQMKQYSYLADILKQMSALPVAASRIFGESEAIIRLVKQIEEVAPSEAPVLLVGEIGTRKGRVAQHIHGLSRHRQYNALSVLSAFGEALESYCFGAMPGVLDILPQGRIGILELAHQGTFYIEKFQLAHPVFQERILTCLKHQAIFRIGSKRPIPVNVRFIFSVDADLQREVEKGVFSRELYDILSQNMIHVPSLRECKKDIPMFFTVGLNWLSKLHHRPELRIDQSAFDKLNSYLWPYNTRELDIVAKNAFINDTDGVITAEDISFDYYSCPTIQPVFGQTGTKSFGLAGMKINEIEKKAIIETLAFCNGNKVQTAKTLGIAEKTLYNKLRDYEIS